MNVFSTFEEWSRAITGTCNLDLTRDYCRTRAAALDDEADPATRAFIAAYGAGYRDQVRDWFRRAENEAVS